MTFETQQRLEIEVQAKNVTIYAGKEIQKKRTDNDNMTESRRISHRNIQSR